MRSLAVPLSLVVACAALLILAFALGGARDGASGERAAPPEPSGSASPPHAPERAVAAGAPAPRVGVADESAGEGDAAEVAADGTEPERPEGTVLRGTVRWSDGPPLSRLRLVAQGAGGVRFGVVSDAEGRFESGPVLGPGRLRLFIGETRDGGGAERPPKGLRFEHEVFLVPADVPTFEVEVRVRRPATHLNVDVRDRADAPVEGAEVSLEVLARPDLAPGGAEQAAFSEHDVWTRTTDAAGRATFALYDVERIQTLGIFAVHRDARGGPALASEHRVLEAFGSAGPERTERLVVDEGARLLVRVLDEARAPLAGMWTWLEPGGEPLFAWLPQGGATDADGELRLDGLPPRSYVVATQGGAGQIRRTVELARGVESELELVLAEGLVPRLAVAGIVLDENGAPLPRAHVTALYEPSAGGAEARDTRTTDERGRFEFHAVPCARVVVLLDGDLRGDEFSPSRLSASFGTQDLVFRRTRKAPLRELDLELVDATTGERLEHALVITVRPPGTPSYEFVSVVGGLITLVVGEHPDVRLLVDAVGHRRRSIAPDELPRAEGERRLHRIEVDPGLLRSLLVVGESGGEEAPVAGAEVLDGARLLGITDRAGLLDLDLAYWPDGPLRIVAPGHRPASWLPADGLGEPDPAVVRLAPLE